MVLNLCLEHAAPRLVEAVEVKRAKDLLFFLGERLEEGLYFRLLGGYRWVEDVVEGGCGGVAAFGLRVGVWILMICVLSG